jgi:hypothetical protein
MRIQKKVPLPLIIEIPGFYFELAFQLVHPFINSSISLLTGIAGAVPKRVTEMAAVADP